MGKVDIMLLALRAPATTLMGFLAVATLTGKFIEVNASARDTVLSIKKRLEDLEGWPIADQSLRTVTNQVLDDTDRLETVGITPEAKNR